MKKQNSLSSRYLFSCCLEITDRLQVISGLSADDQYTLTNMSCFLRNAAVGAYFIEYGRCDSGNMYEAVHAFSMTFSSLERQFKVANFVQAESVLHHLADMFLSLSEQKSMTNAELSALNSFVKSLYLWASR